MRPLASAQVVNVLLIEDSPGDVRLTQEAFFDANPSILLHVAFDGVDAMAFLRNDEPHVASPRPDIILLDLNLPKKDGRQVLAEIKFDENLKRIPTVILTTSDSDKDIVRSYEQHANAYLTKPVRLEDFERLIRLINDFWLMAVKLPKQFEHRQLEQMTPGAKAAARSTEQPQGSA
jgi:two-component system, chemotaxis family, response regulator Rcp1